jgi:serine/threonine-protein phosphatase with EF-hand domain
MALADAYKRGQHLHKSFVHQILTQSIAFLQPKPNITYVQVAPAPHITIVGDLHGQLDDLMLIFRENGVPSQINPYVFNGDIVDRGPRGVECSLLLLTWMLVVPDAVHLNRGNHEDEGVTEGFGFKQEVLSKYDVETYWLFSRLWRWLPVR